jgi:hypothetical protein
MKPILTILAERTRAVKTAFMGVEEDIPCCTS